MLTRNLLIFLLSFYSLILQSQERKEINITSDVTRINEEKFPGAILFNKSNSQVHIKHEGVEMWCDLAIYYKEDNFVKAYKNVSMKQGDSIALKSKYIEYNGDTKFAFAAGNVWLKKDTTTVTSDTMYFDRNKQQSYYQNGGKVTTPNSNITSKVGRYYLEDDKISFIKDVVAKNPEYVIKSNQLDFYNKPEHAYFYGPTTIKSNQSTVYCERGFYDTRQDYGYFVKKSRIDYDSRQVYGDSLYFDRLRNFASATNNIRVIDTANNSLIKGHYAEVYRNKDSVIITHQAVAITVEEKDSVYIHGDKLILTGKPDERIIRGFKNVKLYKSNLSGKCDSIHTNQKTGLTQMINKPILWSDNSQMTGDSIQLVYNTITEKLDSLKVFDQAFIINKDTIDGYNQIKGQKLYGLFNDQTELKEVNIIKNAESLTYLRDESGKLEGIDKSKSATMKIVFEKKTITDVYKYKNNGGEIYPPSQLPVNARLLAEFNWRGNEQLLSKDDIFKGEAPFKLTKIRGIPLPKIDEDFFENTDSKNSKFTLPKNSELKSKNLRSRSLNKPKFGNKNRTKEKEDLENSVQKANRANSNQRAAKPSLNKTKPTILKKKLQNQNEN